MKIAATDYDGTLYRDDTIDDETVTGIWEWRRKGHKFGVVTGRDYGMLVPQLRYYKIDFDFAVCNNGGIILNSDGEVLYQSRIEQEVLRALAQDESTQDSLHFAFSAVDRTYIYGEREGSWIKREAEKWQFPIVMLQKEEIDSLDHIHQLSLGFMTSEASAACSKILNRNYGTKIHAYPNRGSLDITPVGVSKRQGIEKLIAVMRWTKPELFVIGDETNDLPMIEAFGGYTVDSARKEIREKSKASFPSVGAMLRSFL